MNSEPTAANANPREFLHAGAVRPFDSAKVCMMLADKASKYSPRTKTALMMQNGCRRYHLSKMPFLIFVLYLFAVGVEAFAAAAVEKNATSEEIKAFFKSAKKTVLTFVGYSGSGYEDQASMLQQAERILGEFDPKKTIVNIGATPEGIRRDLRGRKAQGIRHGRHRINPGEALPRDTVTVR
jgi:hypothetical protein